MVSVWTYDAFNTYKHTKRHTHTCARARHSYGCHIIHKSVPEVIRGRALARV